MWNLKYDKFISFTACAIAVLRRIGVPNCFHHQGDRIRGRLVQKIQTVFLP